MAVGAVLIRFDDRDLQRWGAAAVKLVENNVRSAIDKSARAARREAIKTMAADSLVPRARFARAVPLVRTTRPGSLIATWTVGKSKNSIRGPGGREITRIPRNTTVAASSYVLSGGGSSHMQLARAFVINANGGRVVMTRYGSGKRAIKPIYAESPHTGMKGDRKPKVIWQQVAENAVRRNLSADVQAALNLNAVAPSSSVDDGGA